jgi:tetratricopeptide (TPR) repeat protein
VNVRNWVRRSTNRDATSKLGKAGWRRSLYPLGIIILGCILSALACGPWMPVELLSREDAALLYAPTAIFEREVARLHLRSPKHKAIPALPASHQEQVFNLELADLRTALESTRLPEERVSSTVQQYAQLRQKLQDYTKKVQEWRVLEYQQGHWPDSAPTLPPIPALPSFQFSENIPAEFQDYLEGAISWHNPADSEKAIARAAWERLLGRPIEERRWKTTWAAFMLGKYWSSKDPQRAIDYFRKLRAFASRGSHDSCGLAAASLGLEAQLQLKEKKYEYAVDLYFEQLAAGDASATNSLRFTAASILGDSGADLTSLAQNPRARRLLTSYLISCGNTTGWMDTPRIVPGQVQRWLTAVETANITDLESAEKLALTAYKANEMDLARRWVKRSSKSPFTQWLQAKLLLHEGKLQPAAKLLSGASRAFPLAPLDPEDRATPWFEETLHMQEHQGFSIGQAACGETGILKLARRDYAQALDCFLRAGFWRDAAYVAERVMTLQELHAFVDQCWAPVSQEEMAAERELIRGSPELPSDYAAADSIPAWPAPCPFGRSGGCSAVLPL